MGAVPKGFFKRSCVVMKRIQTLDTRDLAQSAKNAAVRRFSLKFFAAAHAPGGGD